ncbi:MAG: macro domain-containing protein [Bacteroidota bacterium]
MKTMYKQVEIEISRGDIAAQEGIDAVVNAANAELAIGGGVAGAIHRTAGPQLYEECKPLAPIKPGEAVVTKAYKLPNQYVIHCLGPVYGRDKPEDKLLANCYRNALKLAEEHKISSIAFPALSTGAFGYPIKEATEITFNTILAEVPQLNHLQKLKFVLHSEGDLKIYESVFRDLSDKN